MAKKLGRPSGFTPKLADEICRFLVEGFSLRQICQREGMPSQSMIYRWLEREDMKAFREQYTLARREQLERMVEEILEISDDGSNDYYTKETKSGEVIKVLDRENINRSRLKVKTRKWLLSKLLPKKYGTRLDLSSGSEPVVPQMTVILQPPKEGDGENDCGIGAA